MQYVIGLDEGTTGITALLYTQTGGFVGRAYKELPIYFPQASWVEQDPEEIFQLTVDTIRYLLKTFNINSNQVAGIGITNQRETSLLWDKKTSKACGPAISWQCKRSSAICQNWRSEGLEQKLRKTTGLLLDSYFSASKISWMLKNYALAQSSRSAKTLAFGTIDSWLLWKFTHGSVHATDVTNASRTLLFDLDTQTWSQDACEQLQIPMEILPSVYTSQSFFGETHADFFGHPIPIFAMIGDQHSALFAHQATQTGLGKCTFGTGAFLLLTQGIQRANPPLGILETTACLKDGAIGFAMEGSIFMAGAIVQWLRDQLKVIAHADETDELIKSVIQDHEVVMVPAFTGLGSPHWRQDLRASFFGLSRHSSKAHFVKAAIEAIVFQTSDLMSSMQQSSGPILKKLSIDGGVTHNAYFCQFLANILNIPIEKTDMTDMTALGAAKLAALSIPGFETFSVEQKTQTFVPHMTQSERETRLTSWKKAVDATLQFHA